MSGALRAVVKHRLRDHLAASCVIGGVLGLMEELLGDGRIQNQLWRRLLFEFHRSLKRDSLLLLLLGGILANHKGWLVLLGPLL